MATRKTKAPAVAVPVPDSAESAAGFIKRLGDLNRQHALRKAELDGKVAALAEEYASVLLGLQQQAKALEQGIQVWCEANRANLTNGNKVKTARLVTGEVAWRQRPPSVTVRGEEDVLAALRQLKLADYIRTTEGVNKEAILALDSAVGLITVDDLANTANPEAAKRCAQQKLHWELLKTVKGLSISKGVEDFSITPFETEEATAVGEAQT